MSKPRLNHTWRVTRGDQWPTRHFFAFTPVTCARCFRTRPTNFPFNPSPRTAPRLCAWGGEDGGGEGGTKGAVPALTDAGAKNV